MSILTYIVVGAIAIYIVKELSDHEKEKVRNEINENDEDEFVSR